MKTSTPVIQELMDRQVAFVSYTGNYIGNAQVFTDLFNKLGNWAGPKGLISKESVFLSSYQDDPESTPLDELKLDVCLSIPENTDVDGEIRKKILPGGFYAVMHAELSETEDFGAVWQALGKWVEDNNFSIDMSRPSYEIYQNNPEEHPQRLHIVGICMSVKEK